MASPSVSSSASTLRRCAYLPSARSSLRTRIPRNASSSLTSSVFFPLSLALLCVFTLSPCVAQGLRGLVRRDRGRFALDDGSTFSVAGANCYYLAYSNAAEEGSYELEWVREVLDEAEGLSLNVLRVWAFQDQWWQRDRALQPAPGVYNERFLVALDKLIVAASNRNLRLLLCLTNYWEDYGGAISYVNWARDAGEGGALNRREDFFTSPLCRAWFKSFVTHMVSRVNTITGVPYKEDPGIFAWELINEPRYQGDETGDILQGWIEEMAAHVKSVDGNHMLTVGVEGFYGASSPHRAGDNPISGAQRMGGDFVRNFAVPELDFASIHIWADLWLYCDEGCKLSFLESWIVGHLEEARDTFDKPVVLEEFGKWKPMTVRDRFFRRAFELSLPPNTPMPSHAGGAMCWHLDPDNYPYDMDGFSVQVPGDIGTAEVVAEASAAAASYNRTQWEESLKESGNEQAPPMYHSPDVSSVRRTVPGPITYTPPSPWRRDSIPRYRFPAVVDWLSRPRAVSSYSTAVGSSSRTAGTNSVAQSSGRSPPNEPMPPRIRTLTMGSTNEYGSKATYGDRLTVYAEFDVPLRSPPVMQIDGVCCPMTMTASAQSLKGAQFASSTGDNSADGDSEDSERNGGAMVTEAIDDGTCFTAEVLLENAFIPDGLLNITISGYTSAVDGISGPPVIGMSLGAMIFFDGIPPRLIRASPAIDIALHGGNDHGVTAAALNGTPGVVVRAGDVVVVMLEVSKPIRYPNVTINGHPARVTRTAWDSTSYQASRQIAEDEKTGEISFYVQSLVDFAGNKNGAGISEFTHGQPPRVDHS